MAEKTIHVDARGTPRLERVAFKAALGIDHVQIPDPLTRYEDNKIDLPPWDQAQAKVFKFDADDRAEFARKAIEDSRMIGRSKYEPTIDNDPLLRELHAASMREPLKRWVAWAERDDQSISNPRTSVWYKVIEAYRAKRIILGKVFDGDQPQQKIGPEYDIFFNEQPQIVLVEHNWAAAFAGAQDFSEGEFPLPYERCAFEFMLDGRRAIVVTNGHRYIDVSEIGNGYWVATIIGDLGDPHTNRYGVLYKNIRAICIALDAEVAQTSVVRAPHKLNLARERQGKLPLIDHHVINLTKRSRVEPLPSVGNHEPKWHPRLHFRRGHWRHYENHKTWIKWMLVGDPDLGFIDKEYRA